MLFGTQIQELLVELVVKLAVKFLEITMPTALFLGKGSSLSELDKL